MTMKRFTLSAFCGSCGQLHALSDKFNIKRDNPAGIRFALDRIEAIMDKTLPDGCKSCGGLLQDWTFVGPETEEKHISRLDEISTWRDGNRWSRVWASS